MSVRDCRLYDADAVHQELLEDAGGLQYLVDKRAGETAEIGVRLPIHLPSSVVLERRPGVLYSCRTTIHPADPELAQHESITLYCSEARLATIAPVKTNTRFDITPATFREFFALASASPVVQHISTNKKLDIREQPDALRALAYLLRYFSSYDDSITAGDLVFTRRDSVLTSCMDKDAYLAAIRSDA